MVALSVEVDTPVEEFRCELSAELQKEAEDKAKKLYKEGRSDHRAGRTVKAVDKLAECCSLLTSVHGELSIKVCDAYHVYGSALLDLAQMEDDVLGYSLKGVPSDDKPLEDSQVGDPDDVPEDEKEPIAAEVQKVLEAIEESAPEESKETESSTSGESKEEAKAEDTKEEAKSEDTKEAKVEESKTDNTKEESKTDNTKEESKDEDTKKESNSEEKEDEEDCEETGEEESSQDDEEEERVAPLQIAFEVLELARTIFAKNEGKLSEQQQTINGQVHCKLGVVEMENERYDEAIVLFKSALQIQEKLRDPRELSATYFDLYMACSLKDDYEGAKEHLRKAIDLMEIREKGLEKSSEDPENKSDATELEELRKLKTALLEKMEDLKDTEGMKAKIIKEFKKDATAQLKMMVGSSSMGESSVGFGNGESSGFGNGKSSDDKVTSTLVVRKKRKSHDEDTAPEKKARTLEEEISVQNSEEKK